MIQNPILRGFYPDPSICRAGDDYYIVTSSFSYFPGVPVFHSRDLVNWEQIGHVLDRPKQLHVTYGAISAGIFAPTIRYHEGVFYMITTNMTTRENFICTARDPAGPWSDPHVLEGANGIDPSLFFDEDGKVYFTGTAGGFGDTKYDHQVIEVREVDLEKMEFTGEGWAIGDGALKGAASPEAPHLYRKGGWYYLMIAEGGTEHYHAVTISRSRSLHEPFENYAGNPILTHRHLGALCPICNVGHADIVELPDGSWYMVALASRLVEGYHKPLGRETFLMPMTWENDWPVVSPGTGKVEWSYLAPACFAGEHGNGGETERSCKTEGKMEASEGCRAAVDVQRDDFDGAKLDFCWNYLGTPYEKFARLADSRLLIRMKAKHMIPSEYEGAKLDFFKQFAAAADTRENVPFVGRRVQEPEYTAEVVMEADVHDRQAAGIIVIQNNANQLRLELVSNDYDNCRVSGEHADKITTDGSAEKAAAVGACSHAADMDTVTFRVMRVQYRLSEDQIQHFEETCCGSVTVPRVQSYLLRAAGKGIRYDFTVTAEGKEYTVAADADASHLGSETAGGFVGAYIGMFATGNGTEYDEEAAFDSFLMRF